MDLSKKEIILKNCIGFQLVKNSKVHVGLIKAMEEYAEQESKSFAAWLSNQSVIDGMTMDKLWNNYKSITQCPTANTQ